MKKKNKENNKKQNGKKRLELKEETRHSILAIISLVLGLIFILAYFGKAGAFGNLAYRILESLFGAGFFLVPTVFFIAAISLLSSIKPNFLSHTIIGGILFLTGSLGAADVMFGEKTAGYFGYFVSRPLLKLFDFWASLIILLAVFIISFLIMFNTAISIKLRKKEKKEEEMIKEAEIQKTLEVARLEEGAPGTLKSIKEIIIPPKKEEKAKEERPRLIKYIGFAPPPLELLEGDRGKPSSGDIKAKANIIKRTLQNFGIDVEMDEINIGPSVTQYTLKPAEGVKLSRIVALQNDLSLSLAAYPLRIEAPIPGKSLVGIEIPNTTKTIIGLASLLSEEIFQKSSNPLLFSLGKDVTGKAVFANLSKMPHLLIAGATGTGKSICIHSLITSLLYRNPPEALRFIMIDPKRVELTIYNRIPHLLTPVITDTKKAIIALRWACKDMERRYEELLRAGVRDIAAYHEKYGGYNSMPYIIIVIDELADMMATYPREMEASIVRLAQMSRAVGLHLVVSTQRPSVEVITGLIKANITSRIALQVASQIDCRTILDTGGAEKLLGNGDMLYLAGDTAKPRRIQGAFVSEKEIKKVTKYLIEQYKNAELEEMEMTMENGAITDKFFDINLEEDGRETDDELYEEAKKLVIKTGKASSSYLQRRFRIGYARAARLLDLLEEHGVVGPGEGAKPREVLIKRDDNIVDEYQDIEEQENDH